MISVIIPAVNEAASLGEVIAGIRASRAAVELIVVDAGSSDDTVAVARAAGAAVIAGPCQQRAHQLNLGAKHANGDALLFLHADTLPPEGALDGLEYALRDRRVVGGAFVRRYASPSLLLRAIAGSRTCATAPSAGISAIRRCLSEGRPSFNSAVFARSTVSKILISPAAWAALAAS